MKIANRDEQVAVDLTNRVVGALLGLFGYGSLGHWIRAASACADGSPGTRLSGSLRGNDIDTGTFQIRPIGPAGGLGTLHVFVS